MTNIDDYYKKTGQRWLLPLIVLVALILPLVFSRTFTRHVFIMCLIWSIMGMGWNLLGGYAGQISIGHTVFFGVGAYSVALGFINWNITPWLGIWIGVVISVIIAFITGYPLLRLRGHYFAIATLTIGEAVKILFLNTKAVGGATGLDMLRTSAGPLYSMQISNKLIYYYIVLAFLIAVTILVNWIDKNRIGYYLRTIKTNQDAAESIGINTSLYKVIAYMFSAGIVSIAGSLYAQYLLYIDPLMTLSLIISIMVCLVTILGGVATVYGPIVGAVAFTMINEYSRVLLGGSGKGYDLLFYGMMVILVVLFMPNGIISLFQIDYFIKRRNVNAEKLLPRKVNR
jgi:branched-chain amino acid transport system permease protein